MKFLGNIDPDKFMFLNAIYTRPRERGASDTIFIVYKNRETGEKLLKTIDEPEMDYYITKEEYRDYDYHKDFMPLEQVEKRTSKFKNIAFDIANEAGANYTNYLQNCIQSRNFSDMRKIHGMYNYVYGSDYPIETWYKIQYGLEYGSENFNYPLTKQFLDIEVDGINVEGFPKPEDCPINAITIIDEPSRISYTFLLRNDKNPQIQEFEDTLDDFKKELHQLFDESYGEFEYKFLMYDEKDEIKMIVDLFKLINTLKRDFLLIWNMPFDIGYIHKRIEVLGYDPNEIMTHKDFKNRVAYLIGSRTKIVAERTDRFVCSSYTTFLDQCRDYAGLRKGGGVIRSHKLNDIGRLEIGDEKINYSEDANIKTLPYVNYKRFVIYNIKDVLLQLGIDKKTSDLDNLYLRTIKSVTPYEKAFKQTTFLKNNAYRSFFQQGFIVANNKPMDENHNNYVTLVENPSEEDEEDEQFAGALVANPELNGNNGIYIYGLSSKYIYDFVVDEDFSAMYPSTIIGFNIAASTLIGKLVIEGMNLDNVKQFYVLEGKDIVRFDAGREFIENYLCENTGIVGNVYFNLPTLEDMINDIEINGIEGLSNEKITS